MEYKIFVAFYNDTVVGAVCCRVDQMDHTRRLYIMTLGCLAPYRKLGIGKYFFLPPLTTSPIFHLLLLFLLFYIL